MRWMLMLILQKSAEVTTLEAQINELNAAANTAQNMGRQMHELEVHIQLLDDELARQKGEKESVNALLRQVGGYFVMITFYQDIKEFGDCIHRNCSFHSNYLMPN